MNLPLLLWLLFGLLLPQVLLAGENPDSLITKVALSDAWKKQLYLESTEYNGGFKARIHSEAFYFSDSELIDPQRELQLSLDALFSNLDQINDRHPACQFPGRFLFLNQALQLGMPDSALDNCKAFGRWAGFDQYDTLSVVMVEGYYGNPASSFGHLVLRHGRSDGSQQLLDTSINFGARVPRDEGTASYIINGLTGGYEASFTVESYYRQDLVYTQVEHRDMWNYELDLSETQRRFFLAHVWELLDSPSTYYFLKNNCAFAVAEILEIVFARELVNQNTLFYPPVTLFHELEAIDQQPDVSVIRAKRFVPSQHSVLKALFDSLSPRQQQAFNQYIESDSSDVIALASNFNEADGAELIEALIRYYGYLINGYPELGTELYERRRILILTRLRYPAGRYLQAGDIEPTTEPGKTARVSRISLGAIGRSGQVGYSVGWSPYRHSATDLGNDDFSNLTLLSLEGRWLDDSLETELGVIRVAQRSPVNDRLPGSWPISWTVDIAWQSDAQDAYQPGVQVDLEVGQSQRVGPLLGSGLIALRQSGTETGVGFVAEMGYARSAWLSWVAGLKYTQWLSGQSLMADFESRASISPRWSVELGASHLTRNETPADLSGRLTLNWHYR